MWKIIVFLLLATASYSEAKDYDCYDSYSACGVSDLPMQFPKTRSQLRRTCKIETRFLECVIRFKEKCDEDPESIRVHRELLDAIKNTCNKDNPRYSVVVENLVCMKPIFDDDSVGCYNSYPGHKQASKYAKALRRKGILSFPEDKEARRDCMKGVYVFVCEALKTEKKCGSEALEAYIEMIYARTLKFTGRCNREINSNLMDIVRTVEFEQLLEEIDDFDEYE